MGVEFHIALIPSRTKITRSGYPGGLPLNPWDDWLRVPMYEAVFASLQRNFEPGFFKGKLAIEIGGSEGTIARMLTYLGASTRIAQNYPQINVEELPYEDESFDVIVLDQVMEHLKHPWLAVTQVKRTLRREGIAICTSVFNYPIHEGRTYGDYYRFSPEGFRVLFEDFKTVTADGWGNANILKLAYNRSDRGPEGLCPSARLEAERARMFDYSDRMNYVMTWIVAQRG